MLRYALSIFGLCKAGFDLFAQFYELCRHIIPGTGQINTEFLNDSAGGRRHNEYAVGEVHGFLDIVRYEQHGLAFAQVDLFLKNNKSTLTLGKMYEKYLEWSHPDFTFKNTSEAKKAVQLVNSWKKPLEKMAADTSNTVLQGEASLILAQIDSIGDLLMTKVPQK